MALDDLKETIETLRERIQAHRAYLEGNETRTRQVLIDPMLHKLGWDVGDPNSVELEYRIGRDWADYVLMGSGRPIAVIEAKALGKSLDEKETMQALNYANTAGIPYMTLTNGDYWQTLEVFKQAPIKDRILMKFQLTQDEPYACALQALGLWRPNLASEKPKEAATPVMVEKLTRDESASATSKSSKGKNVPEPSPKGDWVPLDSLDAKPGDKPPASIKFPDATEESIRSWIGLFVSVAEYLIKEGKLSKEASKIFKAGGSKVYLLHTEPVHPTGKPFLQKKELSNGLWLSSFLGSRSTVRNARYLLENFGVNPSTVLVRFQH